MVSPNGKGVVCKTVYLGSIPNITSLDEENGTQYSFNALER